MSWQAANAGLPGTVVLSALAIDPRTPSTLYAGTGSYINRIIDGYGIFKSIDGAMSWQAVNTGLSNRVVLALAINRTAPGTLYAGTEGGVFKSTDAGATWNTTGLTDTSVGSLAIDPIRPRTLYAATYGEGVFKSTDAGATWGALNAGLTVTEVNALAIDPITPGILYAGTQGGGVFSIQQADACIGDCDDSGAVRVSELVTLVNIGLGEAPASMCPHGVPDGAAVDIGWIIAAVGNGLHGCGNGS
jgi:photosystem II stability/assembly factor-like uncharacterized protein